MKKVKEVLNTRYVKAIGLILIAMMAVLVWYSPILFKGYTPQTSSGLLLPKNIIESGAFKIANEKHVILNSANIKQEGVQSSSGQKLSPILFSFIYDFVGLPQTDELASFISIIIYSLALLFFTLTVWSLYSYFHSILFAFVYIFLPTIWQQTLDIHSYEFGFLFLSIGLFFLLVEFWKNKSEKLFYLKYILSGIFLGLSFLSKAALALLGPALLVWLWLYKRKAILPLFGGIVSSIIIFFSIFSIFFAPPQSHYLTLFGVDLKSSYRDFGNLAHLYPEPYTYHFEKQEFIQKKINEVRQSNFITSAYTIKSLMNINPGSITPFYRLLVGPVLFVPHMLRFFSLQTVGGPFVLLLSIIGAAVLYDKDRKIAVFGFLWISVVLLILSFVAAAGRNHIMDFAFIFALFVSVGVCSLGKWLSEYLNLNDRKNIFILLFSALVIYQLVISNHYSLDRWYKGGEKKKMQLLSYQRSIEKQNDLSNSSILVGPLTRTYLRHLTYKTGVSTINITSETMKELLKKDKVKDIFNHFKITHIIGYDKELTEKIKNKADVKAITVDDVKSKESQVPRWQTYIMSIIR